MNTSVSVLFIFSYRFTFVGVYRRRSMSKSYKNSITSILDERHQSGNRFRDDSLTHNQRQDHGTRDFCFILYYRLSVQVKMIECWS